jgi:hypothetical protein
MATPGRSVRGRAGSSCLAGMATTREQPRCQGGLRRKQEAVLPPTAAPGQTMGTWRRFAQDARSDDRAAGDVVEDERVAAGAGTAPW